MKHTARLLLSQTFGTTLTDLRDVLSHLPSDSELITVSSEWSGSIKYSCFIFQSKDFLDKGGTVTEIEAYFSYNAFAGKAVCEKLINKHIDPVTGYKLDEISFIGGQAVLPAGKGGFIGLKPTAPTPTEPAKPVFKEPGPSDCHCGVEKYGQGLHSTWCPKYTTA